MQLPARGLYWMPYPSPCFLSLPLQWPSKKGNKTKNYVKNKSVYFVPLLKVFSGNERTSGREQTHAGKHAGIVLLASVFSWDLLTAEYCQR